MPNKRPKTLKKKTQLGDKEVYMDSEQWIDENPKKALESEDAKLINDLIGGRK